MSQLGQKCDNFHLTKILQRGGFCAIRVKCILGGGGEGGELGGGSGGLGGGGEGSVYKCADPCRALLAVFRDNLFNSHICFRMYYGESYNDTSFTGKSIEWQHWYCRVICVAKMWGSRGHIRLGPNSAGIGNLHASITVILRTRDICTLHRYMIPYEFLYR